MAAIASTLTEEQQRIRAHRFTSTRIVKLALGKQMEVFNEWFGFAPPFKDGDRPKWGRRLERAIIDGAAEEQGWRVVEFPGTVIDPEDDLFATTADFVADGEIAGDAKNRAADQAYLYADDEAQESEIVQVTVHCGVLKKPRGVVAALVGGNSLKVIPVPFDADFWGDLKELCRRFKRDHLDTGKPPPLDGSDAAADYLRAKFPTHRGPMLEGDESTEELAFAYRRTCEAVRVAEEQKTRLGNLLRERIGEAEGIAGAGWKATWKASKGSKATDWEAVARELGAPAEVVAKFTTERPGARRLLVSVKEG